jgi:hypothetical protein
LKTQQEIWESLARPAYPTYTDHQLRELKAQAAFEWCYGDNTAHAKLYDKFVMLKNLMDVSWIDK